MLSDKLIITAALCGAGTTKEQTPYVPITPEEIANDAVACVRNGAAIIHIHVRDEQGKNSMDTALFAHVVQMVRKRLTEENLDLIEYVDDSGEIVWVEGVGDLFECEACNTKTPGSVSHCPKCGAFFG